MCSKRIPSNYVLAFLLAVASAAFYQSASAQKVEPKVQFPSDANGDVFRRMKKSNFDFSKPHDVEFFAVFPTNTQADIVAKLYLADHKAGNRLANIETRPASKNGMELLLVKNMLLTYEAVTEFERVFEERASAHGGYLDGWGVLQEPAP